MDSDFANIKQFLQSPDTQRDDFEWNGVIWVDWREEDTEVVASIAKKVPLAYTVLSTTLPRGIDIVLQFQGMQTKIPYATAYTDRDTTLFAIADIIQPTYELRWYLPSLGSDTLGFCVLPTKEWEVLEKTYGGAQTKWYFSPVSEHRAMFDMDIDEIFDLLEERKKQKGE